MEQGRLEEMILFNGPVEKSQNTFRPSIPTSTTFPPIKFCFEVSNFSKGKTQTEEDRCVSSSLACIFRKCMLGRLNNLQTILSIPSDCQIGRFDHDVKVEFERKLPTLSQNILGA